MHVFIVIKSCARPCRPCRTCHPCAKSYELHTLPDEDPAVYDMICDADTIGVFQIESRAQMSMLPRLRPRKFYDLVIEVAIVRPGPIQGNMVHPYLQRRETARRTVDRIRARSCARRLQKTLGVPLFQEQAMRVVMVAAGFTADEADKLRRAMAAWRKNGGHRHVPPEDRRRHARPTATRASSPSSVFKQIQGFGEYGFPESHAASFALLVYASAWIKRHHPAAFCAALLNSQPMGFYAPAQIVRDAQEHGVEVRPVDVNESEWDCTLEAVTCARGVASARCDRGLTEPVLGEPTCVRGQIHLGHDGPAVRLGFRQIKGMQEEHANAIVDIRNALRPVRFGRADSIA